MSAMYCTLLHYSKIVLNFLVNNKPIYSIKGIGLIKKMKLVWNFDRNLKHTILKKMKMS